MIKYYVWKDNERIAEFYEYEYTEALQFALDNKADEIEKTVWDSEEKYQNREPADEFETVWKKSEVK